MNPVRAVRRPLQRIAKAWTDFWFMPEDPLSLGVARLLVGGMMVYTHYVWGLNLDGFFGPDGWQSLEAVRGYFENAWLPSLWWYVPVEHLRLVHSLCLIPLVMFMLGLASPVTSVLALAITISNSNRAPLANYGLDQIMSMLALYLVIGGSGDRLSLDAWLRRRLRRRRAAGSDAKQMALQPPIRTSRARLATRLIQVHICIIYFFAGISKLQGDAWWNGEAVWMAFANKEYQSLDMTWLARYPWVTQIATHMTVLFELSFAFLIWNRWMRPVLLAVGFGIHFGIGACMGMITFGSIMIFGYIAFVPPELIQTVMTATAGIFVRRREKPKPEPRTTHVKQPSRADTSDSPIRRSRAPRQRPADAPPTNGRPTSPSERRPSAPVPIAICDPEWRHRDFAHYLAHRGFAPFMTHTPARLWCQVEQHGLQGVVMFVDRMSRPEYDLLLQDLTLSPVCELPVIIASQRPPLLDQAKSLAGLHLRVVSLPAAFREIRQALEGVIAGSATESPRRPSVNGHQQQPRWSEADMPSASPGIETSS